MAENNSSRILAEKYQPGGEFYNKIPRTSTDESTSDPDTEKLNKTLISSYPFVPMGKPKKGIKTPKITFFTLIKIGIILLAGIKNPSQMESREQVKSYIFEQVNDFYAQQAGSEDKLDALGTFLISTFAPKLIDKMVHIETTDYVLLSTFEARIQHADIDRNIASGIILFGKIIPLFSDLKQ